MESPRLARLSPEEKRALLARLLQRKLGKAPVAAPLSAGQRALWFLHRLDPESAAYNLHFCAAIRSRLDVEAFRRALQTMIDRHACLRSTFVDRPDGPVQLVYESAEPALDVVDAAGWSDEKLHAELLAEAHGPFSLEKGPVLRTRLFMRGEADPVCLLTVHHIVSDFWTLGVLMNDLGAIYPTLVADAEVTLPPPTGEYADFVRWQVDLLAGAEGQRLWEFWRGALSGELPTLNLPTDRPRPAVQTDRGSTYRFRIDAPLANRLRDLARSEGATFFAVLLAGFQALLHRLTGQDDVLVGSPVAGRSRPEFAGLVGYFVNMIVLRAQLHDRPTFRQFLAQVRQTALDGLRNGDYPFAQLVERLQPERDLSRHALFQAAFVLKRGHGGDRAGANGHVKELKLGGLVAEPRELDHQAVPFDCNLMVEETRDELNCALEYNTDLFDESTIARWMECFRNLLESAVANPDCSVDSLAILSKPERAAVLTMSQGPAIVRPATTLHRLIEEQVNRSPDQPALRFGEDTVSYRELNERANRLARHLRSLGAGRDVPIALCLDRSLDLSIALLAVLKAGSCYVPLDSDLPCERLAFLLGDLLPAAVLTQSHLADRLPPTSTPIVRLDCDSDCWASADSQNLALDPGSESLAYIIYTSGSTGQPKGCANTHRGIVNRLLWMQEAYGLTSRDRVIQKTPYSFDVSVWEFFWPLIAGAELVIAEPEGHRDPDYLARTIAAERITVLHFVPSMLQAFLQAKNLDDCTMMRDVICSGEALSWDLQERFFERFPKVRLHNLYGPTEAAVDVTAWECDSADARRLVPIGRPIANTQVLVLDRDMQPTPIGVPGELYLGGVQLARGYWNRPELTAERFVPHPQLTGERVYKTGDLGRFLDDGTIQYLGRLDHQVKIRGFRIELGEIEAALMQSALVYECVVVARTDGGVARLIAYIVPRADNSAPSTTDLRAHLADKLPEFMIPAQFVVLAALPLLSNGKVNRSALPAPELSRPDLATAFVAPRTPTESRLAQIWAEVLRVESIGAFDRFFELGGHSLLATQVVTRVRAEFGVELPLRRFFESPSLADLAAAIDEHSGPAPAASMTLAALRPAPRDRALPMSFGQETLWFLDQLVPGNTTYNVPAAVRIAGPLDFEALRKAFEAIVHRHESLRSTFALEGDRRVIAIRDPESLSLEIIDLRELPASERETRAKELTEIEARKPFNLATGPLLRLSVLRVGELDQIVLMTVHHIAFDGWSTGVLISEFAALYRGFVGGSPTTLPALPIQFPDLAYWQKQWFADGLLDNQLEYWKKQLQGIPPLLALPTDRPRPQVWSFRGAAHKLHFPPSLVADLRALGKREGCTLFMTLLAAFQTLLHRYSGMDDICVGSPIANRNRAEIEGLIGFVVNTLVLRGNLAGNPTFAELLRRTREMAFGAYSHQDLPFEQVMRAITPNRDARHSSLFQVLFVLQNAPVHIPPLPNLTPQLLLDAHNGTSKFDLTLGLTEMPEGLIGILEYNCDLFDASTIERMAVHFRRLLEAVVADANRALPDLPLLTDDEQRRGLAIGEGERVAVPVDCFHRRFEAQVAANPTADALVWGAERLTYDQLNRRANQLAHELRDRGVVPDSIVGLCFERSTEMVVAVLAVLKAGGGYLPLDPALPRERLNVILDDAKPVLVLTQQRLAADIPFDAERVLRLDTDAGNWSHHSSENPAGGAGPRDIAYVIYTSGSTGTPKGCVIEQGSLDNGYLGWQAAYQLENYRAHLQMANFAFDVFTADLVRTLGSGAKLVLCPSESLLDPEKLIELIRREEIHYTEFVPAVVRPLLRRLEATSGNLGPVKIVVVGADIWYGGEYRRLRRALGPDVRVFNSYGLTEATIDNTFFEGSDEGLHDEGPIPIGRPYANQRVCVLDSKGHLQPVGVPGELHVGGEALARCYLNRPELTAEKFVPDPFHRGERLYKSGDLARLLPSGQFELLGRTDHQVKIRGFRIELGEIEAILTQFSAVRDAVVVARDDGRGIKRLLAYVVVKDGAATPTATDLRAFLGSKLPEYMVPSAFMTLEALPMSPNGKVDRNALPALEAGRGELAAQYVVPVSASEIKLAALWGEVLRVERVGLRDSFFELGGHSLLATQVLARVRAEFDVELPLRKLFEAPVLADFAAVIDAAERAKQGPALVHLSDQNSAPLSYAQQRLWFLDRLEPGNPVYHVATAVRLTGTLDRAIWERCFLEVCARHDILRTAFPATDGRPEAVVAPSVALNVNSIDLSDLPADQHESRARQEALREYSRPFDLARGPLFRIALLKLSSQEHILLLTMHHIIADGGSLGVFLRDLAELYARHSAGQGGSLSPLPIQYADFARWQQQWLEGGERDRQLAFWRERLADAPVSLDLPTDRPRPPIQTSAGAIESRVLPPALADAIRSLSNAEGVTPYMTLLAGFEALLHRYTGQDDLLIGTPVSNRSRVEIESLIGCFVNTLVLRSDLSGAPTFRTLLGRTRENVMQALAHQELPFEALVEGLQTRRDPSRTPLFQVMFVWQSAPTAVQLPGLSLKAIPIDQGTAMFDLTIIVTDDEGQIIVSAEYNTDLYDRDTIARLLRHFESLLEQVAANPDTTATAARLLNDDERRKLLVDWNATDLNYPREKTVLARIADWAVKTPEAIAVEDGAGSRLTYGELEKRSTRLAARLAQAGAVRGDFVGLGFERDLEMAIGLLGILKAGAAYLPLDPQLPAERLRFVLDDAGVRIIVKPTALGNFLPEWRGVTILVNEERRSAQAAAPGGPLPKDPAYVIYTSGSTGTPKGVVVTHQNLHNLCAGTIDRWGLNASDRVLQFTSLSFDVAVEEIFPAWASGATVVLRPSGPIAGAVEFFRFLDERRISMIELPSSYWHELTAELEAEPRPWPESLRMVVVGGEAARHDAAIAWQRMAGSRRRWINAYGPTETTVTSAAFEPAPGETLPSGSVPIGRPIANTRVYVLDRAGDLAPVGLPGELVIGGEGVTLGYLNAPELTAARFVPDRFSGHGKMYRTGDRVRWRSDGQLEFLGRFDEQVKVRGFRVEPGEIETALGQHPAVRAVAIVPQEDSSGQLQLIGYVALNDGIAADAEDLLSHLRGRVPTYLLPAAIAILSDLPRTTSGKIDRRALAASGAAAVVNARPYVAPRTPTEEKIAASWAELFGVEKVSAEDNFFDLGGHSLMAVQLAARMSRALDCLVPVRAVILHPTVSALAQAFDDDAIGDERVDESRSPSLSGATLLDNLGPHVSIERRSLEDLVVSGEIAAVQSAAIGYLPSSLLRFAGLKAEDVVSNWLGNRPVVSGIFDWELGRIATVLIPLFDSQLYNDQTATVAAIVEAMRTAKRLGASTVSLTGLLPSATDYGRAVERAALGQDLPRITTGHATTAAAVVLAIRRILTESRRDLARERVAFVGLGSIGSTVLQLLLRSTPHPAELILCDVFAKRDALRKLEQSVRTIGFEGPIRVCESQGAVPHEAYAATLIVGATNAADLLDVDRLRPGTLIVDDSAPHIFRPDQAMRRLRHRGDILFTEGGTLWAREPICQTVHLPTEIEPLARLLPQDVLPMHDPRQITGCIASSLLSTRDAALKPTVGLVDADLAAKHLDALTELGFTAAQLHCEGFALEADAIANFRDRFGESPVARSVPTTTAPHLFDWRAEASLDPAITAAGLPPVSQLEPKTILLTGATGFLGAFLLGDLLELTSARIVCLVRAGSDGDARKRIDRNLAQYLIDVGDRSSRIVPLAGDLARPRLGLTEEQFSRLSQDVDVIYHNGAQVHFLHPYSTLKPANVLGTQEVLRLATTARLKPVHFVSTLSVLSGLSKGRLAVEIDRNETPEWLENGYAQSKWVAERLVWSAMERGVPATILRPGRIVWHSRSGALNQDDVFTRALRACIQIAAVPALDSVLEMTPVDFISRATIAIGQIPTAFGHAYHLFNRQYVRLQDLLNWVRAAGYPLEVLPPDQWLARVQSSATHDAQDALAGLLPLLANGVPFLGDDSNLGPIPGPNFDGQNTQAILAGTGVESPAIGPNTVAVYLARLVADGLLTSANKGTKPAASSPANGPTRRRGNRSRSHGTK